MKIKLAQLQKWMQAVVVHPGPTRRALRAADARQKLKPAAIGRVLLPSPTLSPEQRIAIYQEMYPLRMRDALSVDYPGLQHFLGDRFDAFVEAYIAAHPSRGYTLNRLGDHVPAFLARQRRFTPRPFLVDLARLELALSEAFDERESSLLTAEEFDAIPKARLERTRLATVPSLRLVTLSWNADAYLDSIRDKGHRHPRIRKRPSYAVVFRRKYVVYRLSASPAAFALLEDVAAGRPLGQLVTRSLARRGPRRASIEDFSRWFRLWTSEGVFAGVVKRRA